MMYQPSNSIIERLRALFKRRVGDTTVAFLGDSDGAGARIDVPGKTGYVYVRFPNGRSILGGVIYSSPYMVRSAGAAYPRVPGFMVNVGWSDNGELEIKSANHKALDQAGYNTAALNPLDQQSKFVYPWQWTVGLASAVATFLTASTLVTVKSFRHYVANRFRTFETPLEADKIDLASFIPAADLQCMAAIWIDTYTNTYTVTASTPQALNVDFDDTDFDELIEGRPADAMPLKAFILANGQIKIMQSPINETDLRQHLSVPPIWGFPHTLTTIERVRGGYTLVVGPYTASGTGALTPETGGRILNVHKSNVAGSNPTVNDDSDDGYDIGSYWLNSATGILYLLTNATVGAAVWAAVTAGTGYTSPLTTKGDVYTRTSSADARVAIGTIGQYFTPDTAASTGNKWDYATLDIAVTWGEDVSLSSTASVYQKTSDGKWYIANPVSNPPLISSRRGIILSTGASFGAINTAGVVRLRGPASGGSSLLANSPTYLLGAGTIGATPPTVTLDSTLIVVAMMGYALTTNSSYVQPYSTLTYRQYVTMAAGAEIDITHYSDITDKSRTARAFAIVYDSILAEDYASSNQDAVLQLKGQSGAGAATSADTAGGTNYGLGDVGGTETRQAQSFTLTAGQLSQVTFTLRANSGSPSVGITVSVRDDNAGVPAAATLYSSVVTTPTASAQNTVNISGGPFLSAGTYWLVLELSANQSTNVRYNMDGSAGSVYAGGVSKADTVASLPFPGTWGTSNAGDLRTSITTSNVDLYSNIAQGVSHTGTPNVVTSVKLWLRRVGSSSDNLTVSLCADSAGSPGSVITDGTSNAVVMSTLGTSFAYAEFPYSVGARPSLSSGVQYWIKLETTGSASNTVYVEVGTDNTSPSYANGQTKTDTGGTWSATSPASDSIFELYIQNDAFQEQLSIGQWSDPTTGQIGVRYGITFNNATDTQTSFKNNTDGTIIALLDVIMG